MSEIKREMDRRKIDYLNAADSTLVAVYTVMTIVSLVGCAAQFGWVSEASAWSSAAGMFGFAALSRWWALRSYLEVPKR